MGLGPRSRRSDRPATVVRAAWSGLWPPAALLAVAIGAWEGGVRWSGVSPSVLPAPSRVVRSAWEDRAALGDASWVTLRETLIGMALAIGVAMVIAVLIDALPWLRRGLEPLLVGSQVLPIVAIAPLMVIWLGFGLAGKVLVVALYTFFPICVGLARGLRAAEPAAEDLLRTMGAGRLGVLRRVRLPAAMPSAFTGLRLAATYAVVAAVLAEFLGAFDGLGVYMQQARGAAATDLIFAAVVATFLLTMAIFVLVRIAERLLAPWSREARST